ncbi:MAG TPA: pitrilysin family protein [Thermoanaerobaculia bacterium]|nr:pitrilysin family protein [Thermoanaerobaculia bacterium]
MTLTRRIIFILSSLLVAASAFGQAKKDNRLTFPKIEYTHRTLSNGMEVYSIPDHSSPTVAIQVWYRVGSKDDPPGRSGFAHLFEHIMFKSTKHMADEQMDRLTEDVGGGNNATTRDDATQYFEIIPSNYLETLLWAEGERLGSLSVNEKNFQSERDVVKEEYRFRVLSQTYGLFYNAIDKDSFAVHPYKRPGIGSIEDLDAATIADVQQFHRTYYRPDNAVRVVAGDFDQKQLDAWIDRYLGVVPKPSTPIPRVTVKEPTRTEEKRFTEYGANVPLPAVGITWLTPAASEDDSYPLAVVAELLGTGESSRLYRSLVYRDKIAQDIAAYSDSREDAGLFVVMAFLASEHTPEEAEKTLLAEVAQLAKTPPPDAELEKAKNLIITSALRRRQTNEGKAEALGNSAVVNHDAEEANIGLAKLQAVTPKDVQRVVAKYLGDGKPVVITYSQKPEGAKP